MLQNVALAYTITAKLMTLGHSLSTQNCRVLDKFSVQRAEIILSFFEITSKQLHICYAHYAIHWDLLRHDVMQSVDKSRFQRTSCYRLQGRRAVLPNWKRNLTAAMSFNDDESSDFVTTVDRVTAQHRSLVNSLSAAKTYWRSAVPLLVMWLSRIGDDEDCNLLGQDAVEIVISTKSSEKLTSPTSLSAQPWNWDHSVIPKRWYFYNNPNGVISQKTGIFSNVVKSYTGCSGL
jgi:hypothetical protein